MIFSQDHLSAATTLVLRCIAFKDNISAVVNVDGEQTDSIDFADTDIQTYWILIDYI